MTKIGV